MLRSSYFLGLGLALLLAASPVYAQSETPQQTAVSQEVSTTADDQDHATTSVVLESRDAQRVTSRQDVADVMLGTDRHRQQASLAEHAGAAPSIDFAGATSSPPMQVQDNSNRRLYYIIGGVLVAGGLAAGILALSDDGDVGIPPPPGRP
jgi:hypothetical protein